MLKNACINPEIMKAISLCGHGDKILIADGNYPLDAESGDAKKVYLGLTAGIPTVTDTLKVLSETIGIESALVMTPGDGTEPPIFKDLRGLLDGVKLETIDRWGFYSKANEPKVRLAISTGEKRTYACIILTVGVV